MLILIVSDRKLLLELLCRSCFPSPLALLLSWVMLQCQGFLQQTWIYFYEVQQDFRAAQKSIPQPLSCRETGLSSYFPCWVLVAWGFCLQLAEHHVFTQNQLASRPEGEQHLGAGFGAQ